MSGQAKRSIEPVMLPVVRGIVLVVILASVFPGSLPAGKGVRFRPSCPLSEGLPRELSAGQAFGFCMQR